jgi:predicted flap endonuclease-1-like 5' DNA nuclease
MLFSTPTQFAVLALCLVAGWLFGLASAPGGRKLRDRLIAEEAAHKATREEIATRDARLRELERERERERWEADRVRASAAPVAAAGTATTAAATSARGGWFGWGRDNLSRIRGIDEPTETALRGEGIKTYAAIEALTPEEETRLEDKLGFGRGRIAQQQWREQAALLREGRDDDHAARWN